MSTKNQILMGLILVTISKVMMITPANAWPDSSAVQSNNFVPDDFNFSSGSTAGGIGGGGGSGSEGFTSSIAIPPEMSSPTGATDGSGISSDGSGISGDGGNASTEGTNSTGTITVTDIANYYANSIDRSLNDLEIGEVAQKPRRIVRRRSAVCPNPQISRSSEKLDELLDRSEQFIEQVNQIKPENRIW